MGSNRDVGGPCRVRTDARAHEICRRGRDGNHDGKSLVLDGYRTGLAVLVVPPESAT
jgi:hypothetical protein